MTAIKNWNHYLHREKFSRAVAFFASSKCINLQVISSNLHFLCGPFCQKLIFTVTLKAYQISTPPVTCRAWGALFKDHYQSALAHCWCKTDSWVTKSYCVRPQVQHPERAPSQQLANCIRPVRCCWLAARILLQPASADEIMDARGLSFSHWAPRSIRTCLFDCDCTLGAHCISVRVCLRLDLFKRNHVTIQQSHIWFQEHQRECQRCCVPCA
jgi:hypothetical protein